MFNKIKYFVLVLFLTTLSTAQSVYVPVNSKVYEFLSRMESKGLLSDFRDAAKPMSRISIAKALNEVKSSHTQMTRVDRDNYEFFVTEFKYELLVLEGDNQPSEMRWHLFTHDLQDGKANYDINYRYGYNGEEGKKHTIRSQGLTTYGYAFKNIGYYFNWIDNLENGDNINFNKTFTPEQGITLKTKWKYNQIEYNSINAQFSWTTGPVDLSIEKISNVWGYGTTGGVILTNKAPSYPQIKMKIPLSKNIDFIYFHGELNSNEMDSSRSYYYSPHLTSDSIRHVDRQKYIAAHLIEFSLFNGVDLSLGESVIYSDRGPLFIYLIPVMFFKSAEHYNGDKDNTQMFGTLKLNVVKNTSFFLSLFLDELNTDELFDPDKSRRQVAFNSGLRLYDLGLDNLEFYVEYMRANYAVYNHKYAATTFTNNGYDLGSWIGQNADYLYWECVYTPIRKLSLTAFYDVFRKGEPASILNQYSADGGRLDFLQGKQYISRSYGITLNYQPVRDLFISCGCRINSVKDENVSANNKKNSFEFNLAAQLGIW